MAQPPSPHPDEALLLRFVALVVGWALIVGLGLWIALVGFSPAFLVWGLVSAVGVIGGAIAYRVWIRLALNADPVGDEPQWAEIDESEVRDAKARLGEVGIVESAQFLLLVANPRGIVVRLVESLKPRNRSTEITSTITMRLLRSSAPFVVPLTRRRRGGTDQGVSVTDHTGRDAPVLPKADVIAYAVACIRRLLESFSEAEGRDEILRTFDERIAQRVSDGLRSSSTVHDIGYIADVQRLGSAGDVRITTIARALQQLSLYDFACVEVDLPPRAMRTDVVVGSGPPADPPLRRESHLARFVVRRRDILVYDAPASRTQALAARLRTGFGIPVSNVFVRLDDANRCQSYHAELVGPDHSFLARQVIYRRSEIAKPDGLVVAMRRLGQRHAHLYLRTSESLQSWRYAATFYERMPSSLAPVSISAIALLVLTGIGLVTLLLGNTSGLVGQPGFAATLLGVPSAISVWSGVQRDRSSLTGASGGLATLAGTALTIATAIGAVVVNLEAGADLAAWVTITWLAGANALFLTSGWIARAAFLHSRLYLHVETPDTDDHE